MCPLWKFPGPLRHYESYEEGDPGTGSGRKGQGPCVAGDVMERAETRTVYEWRAVVDLTA